MTDDLTTPAAGPTRFCGECGSEVDREATFCGECGTAVDATVDADEVEEAEGDVEDDIVEDDIDEDADVEVDEGLVDEGGVDDEGAVDDADLDDDDDLDDELDDEAPTAAGPVIERVPEPTVPPPPPPTGPATQPIPTVPPPGAPAPAEADEGTGRGPKVLVAVLLLIALVVGGLVLFGGGDDDGEGDATSEPDEADDEPGDEPDATTTEPDDASTSSTPDTTAATGDFVSLVDDTGRITVEVPADWSDTELAPDDGIPRILAAPDTAAFETGFEVPGLDLRLIDSPPQPDEFDATLDTVAEAIGLPGFCTSEGKGDYADGAFTGRQEVWSDCAEIGTRMVLTFAQQEDGQTVFIGVQLTAADDPAIADQVAASVAITG